jgi:hypothetical protein
MYDRFGDSPFSKSEAMGIELYGLESRQAAGFLLFWKYRRKNKGLDLLLRQTQ